MVGRLDSHEIFVPFFFCEFAGRSHCIDGECRPRPWTTNWRRGWFEFHPNYQRSEMESPKIPTILIYPSQSLPSWFGYTPGSTNIAGWKTGPDWRCISYWKWGYSIAMLVYQRVYVFTIRTHFCLLFFVGWWNMKGWHYFSDGLEPVCRGLSLHRMKGCCLIFQKGYYLFHPVTSSKVKVQFIGIHSLNSKRFRK